MFKFQFITRRNSVFSIKFFTDNGYPNNIVYKCVRLFLENVYNPKVPNVTVPKLDFYCKLPYIGDTEKLNKELRCCLDKFYPHINFKFVFSNNFTLNTLLPYKDKLPDSLRSTIVSSIIIIALIAKGGTWAVS